MTANLLKLAACADLTLTRLAVRERDGVLDIAIGLSGPWRVNAIVPAWVPVPTRADDDDDEGAPPAPAALRYEAALDVALCGLAPHPMYHVEVPAVLRRCVVRGRSPEVELLLRSTVQVTELCALLGRQVVVVSRQLELELRARSDVPGPM
jgi:hypothetical protein